MCLSDEFVVSSGAIQLLDKFVAYYAYCCCILSSCSAEWQCFFVCCVQICLLTYLFGIYLQPPPQKSRSTFLTPFRGPVTLLGGLALLGLLVILT